MSENNIKKYVIVGLGSRSDMFSSAILDSHKEYCQLLALCDTNQGRMDWWNRSYKEKFNAGPFKTYDAADFDTMISEQKPDTVIVTATDRVHHKYICRAMELGCDVISEKPMTIDAERNKQIFDTIETTGRNLTVTFNYRYSPRNSLVKELIQNGEIGEVISVHFEWMLNTKHGADYFRRWHRDKKNSGGLMVHKSTHHFDLVNWWLDDTPSEVFGMGRLAFYGQENAENRGVKEFYPRCKDNIYAMKDPFALNLMDGGKLQGLYADVEEYDGYIRDHSVFSQGISIEDTMSVLVRYKSKATLTYSLNAFCPCEGYKVSFNGTKGRIEMDISEMPYVSGSAFDQNNPDFNMSDIDFDFGGLTEKITVQKLWGEPREVEWDKDTAGGHGGGDKILMDDIFKGAGDDPLKRAAGPVDGAKSILVGIAANKSFETGQMVSIDDLFKLG
ncbi:MAG: Gfo/Idh/MocA family oxidoreductase [Spirochaetales bacterium]|nr:Gfo/Idh/MocA family oxidoreductase [Spirochaetales bacterium]